MKEIVQDGAHVLRQIAKPIPEKMYGGKELKQIIADMEEVLDSEPDGVALAAPQIGIPYRIFLVRHDRLLPPVKRGAQERPKELSVYINPELVKASRRKAQMEEGCLSVRGLYGTTSRFERATVQAHDVDGTLFERGGGSILAQAFQHEIDHLNGILFIDHAKDVHEITFNSAEEHRPFVYFGTPYVARDTLEILSEEGYLPSLIVTSPDAPRGRGLALTPSETKVWAETHAIPVITPEKFTKEVIEEIFSHEPAYGIAVAYGKLLPESLLNRFPLGVLNIHYSLLPKYRGASPVEAALLHGEKETGVTIQKMAKALDTGDIVAQVKVQISPEETTKELRARLIAIGAHVLRAVLPHFEDERVTPTPQNEEEATHCGKIAKSDGELNLAGDAEMNWNKYRAYRESPTTYFFVKRGGKNVRVKIKEAKFENGTFTPLRITPEGKKEMDYTDFLRA